MMTGNSGKYHSPVSFLPHTRQQDTHTFHWLWVPGPLHESLVKLTLLGGISSPVFLHPDIDKSGIILELQARSLPRWEAKDIVACAGNPYTCIKSYVLAKNGSVC